MLSRSEYSLLQPGRRDQFRITRRDLKVGDRTIAGGGVRTGATLESGVALYAGLGKLALHASFPHSHSSPHPPPRGKPGDISIEA